MIELNISKIKEIIPKECFVKNPLLGTGYIIFDFSCWALTVGLYYLSPIKPLPVKAIYWGTSGFFMWCQFMNGHDCGHGSFSDSRLLNNVMGHLTHTPLLVPFSTWAESHKRHHLGHNHVDKDYSHLFVTNPKDKYYVKPFEKLGLYSVVGWFYYMIGYPDGGHWIPIGGRLWRDDYSLYRHAHCVFSSSLVFGWLYFVLRLCEFNFYVFMEWYGASWFAFSWWLTTVTYLQHHDNTVENTIVYDDKSWTFLTGALQTVDRSYGYTLDTLMHNITNGHLVHHIFFTKIPHYRLEKATRHLYKYLKENGVEYKYRYTPYFWFDIFKQIMTHMSEVTLK
jgi:omega-3 fatty acid desaturase (delta-15 desaturase)